MSKGSSQPLTSAIAGLVAVVAVDISMTGAKRLRLLGRTISEDSEDWLDRKTGSRSVIGRKPTSYIERFSQAVFSTALGYGFSQLRKAYPRANGAALGLLYGGALGVLNSFRLGPLYRFLRRGDREDPKHTA